MKKIFMILVLLLPTMVLAKADISVATQVKARTMLVYDVTQKNGKLRNYRNTSACWGRGVDFSKLNLQGFADLNMSGSAQFSAAALPYILQQAKGTVYIIDLRQEPHGFINGKAFTKFSYRNQININKNSDQITQEETQLLSELALAKHVTLHKIKKIGGGHFETINNIAVKVAKVEAEQELVKQAAANYVRLHVLDRHKPCDAQVDEFIALVRALPKDAWLHFHCRAGKGRTTTFMVMYDMIHNAKQVSFNDILARHIKLGGSLLDAIPATKESAWTKQSAIERYEFIRKFYDYVVAKDGYGTKTWSEWVKEIHSS